MVDLKRNSVWPGPGRAFVSLAILGLLLSSASALCLPAPQDESVLAPEEAETTGSQGAPEAPGAPRASEEAKAAEEEARDAQERSRDAARDEARARRSVDKDTQIHVGSDLVVHSDEVARDAVVFSGSLDVRGKVIGDAVAILGPATIDGEVTGQVIAVGGSIYLEENAEVMGDVTSIGGSVLREDGARVLGSINEVDIGVVWPELPMFWRFEDPHLWDLWHMGATWSAVWTVFKWILLILLTSAVLLIAPTAVERTSRQIRGEFWKSTLLGLVAVVFFPFLFVMVCVVLAITIIGIPLLIVVIPLAVMLLIIALLLGYTSAAYAAGGWLGRRFGWTLASPYAALLVGVVAIQVLSLVANLLGSLGGFVWPFAMMFGLAGWFVRFVAWTAGLGGALLTQLGRRELAAVAPTAAAPPPPADSAPPSSPPPAAPPPSGD